MPLRSTGFDVKSVHPKVWSVCARYTGGGAASNMTKTAGNGIASVNYNSATGAYIITFNDVGAVFLGGTLTALTGGTTAAQKVVNPVVYSSSAKTLTIFITDVATPTAADLSTSEQLWIDLKFSDSSVY